MVRMKNEKQKIIAIIPARAGSKRLPNKNILELSGKPLIAHTIEASFRSKHISRTIVSTDSEEIKKISEQYGAEVIERPKHLATDTSPTIDTIKHAISSLHSDQNENIIIVLLQPTSPFRTVKTIDACIEQFIDKDADMLITTSRRELGPEWILSEDQNGKLQFVQENSFSQIRAQDQSPTFELNGCVHVYAKKLLLTAETYAFGSKTYGLEIDKIEAMQIDTFDDMEIASTMMRSIEHVKK